MTLWGGRFAAGPSEVLWRYTADDVDRRLLAVDVRGSIAHATMLGETGIIPTDEAAGLVAGLERIAAEAAAGEFAFAESDEDVHTAVERRLGELVGPVAGKLHTGRSRNDQVALDLRLYLGDTAAALAAGLREFRQVLAAKAEEVGNVVVPSFTHLQQAQSVPLAHHLLAHAWALGRDGDRFDDAADRINVSPLGAGVGGGSALPLDPQRSAELLGLPAVFTNSMDAVADRDFAAEFAFCCAQAMAHCSRLAEELVLWSSAEFAWAGYGDELTTGSSALPHKQNPDIAELARGRAPSVFADVATLLGLQKGLPLTYNRDLQEDKAPVFHAADTLAATIEALAAMVAGATFDPLPPGPWVGALDLAEVLVERGVPFREAHHAVGRLVAVLVADGRTLVEATADDLLAADDRFQPGDQAAADPAESVRRRSSPGGGSFESVAQQFAALRASSEG
jgi:argininosuccinate lyase